MVHNDPHIAHHVGWKFRPEAVFLSHNNPPTLNFWTLAVNLRDWMSQQGKLRYSTSYDKQSKFANPHTASGALLNVVYASILNDAHSFINNTSEIDPIEAEITRVRLNTELTLYAARISECLIKQLLFLTTLADEEYSRASLGELLSRWCTGCEDCKGARHRVSLLGSLAHRYGLCRQYEECLATMTRILNRRRNFEVAHSGVMKFYPQNAKQIKDKFKREIQRFGTDFLHMLTRLADIEEHIMSDLQKESVPLAFSSKHPQIVDLHKLKTRRTKLPVTRKS